MKKRNVEQSNHIVIYRRSAFGALKKIASYDGRLFEARISTCGSIRINKMDDSRGGFIAAFAKGEWHVCTRFVEDWS